MRLHFPKVYIHFFMCVGIGIYMYSGVYMYGIYTIII